MLCLTFVSLAQKVEAFRYYILVSDESGREALPFVSVKLHKSDTVLASGTTNFDGVCLLSTSKVMKNAKLKIVNSGYKTLEVTELNMKVNDTLKLFLEKNMVQLPEMVIVDYRVPLIDPDRPAPKKWYQRKKPEPPKPLELVIEYTREELAARNALLKGFIFPDSSNCARIEIWPKSSVIKYPEKAKDAGIQEKFWVKISYYKGCPVKAIAMRGSDPSLALEVYKFLKMKPGFRYTENAPAYFEIWLPIVFKLE